jgi:hypothetical protein
MSHLTEFETLAYHAIGLSSLPDLDIAKAEVSEPLSPPLSC